MTESKPREFCKHNIHESHYCGSCNRDAINKLQSELATLRQVKSSMSDVMDQKDREIEALKAREIAHLALIQDSRKRIKSKDELLAKSKEQLEVLIHSFMDLRVADGPKKFVILRSIDDKISDALMVLKKLREGKK